ncbi:UNKNOWN [Stylonychia lemnae]|uniref:NPHP4 C2-like domain-containing protein n=1 Tax=Stylonychia lemnae TaxID=5949 RepID=A0A078AQS3_STYLE|nr:UNKNOWN [Stylonychia lemnae]|eukprot:CDW83592.1 UNKNOWN [Stylonychia lemnae]
MYIEKRGKELSYNDLLRKKPTIDGIYVKFMLHNTWKVYNEEALITTVKLMQKHGTDCYEANEKVQKVQDGHLVDQEKILKMKFAPGRSLNGKKLLDIGYFAPLINNSNEDKKFEEHSYWKQVKDELIQKQFYLLSQEKSYQFDKTKSEVDPTKDLSKTSKDEIKKVLQIDEEIKVEKTEEEEQEHKEDADNSLARDRDEISSQYSEFMLYKEDPLMQDMNVLIDELTKNMIDKLDEDPTILIQPSYIKQLLQKFMEYIEVIDKNNPFNMQNFLKNLTPEKLTFILEFLVSLILKNFKTGKLIPDFKSRESLLFELVQFDPSFKKAINLMISNKLSEEDKVNLYKMGIGHEILEDQFFHTRPDFEIEKLQLQELNNYKIQFHFMTFKTTRVIYESGVQWPTNIALRFQFFNFKMIQTFEARLYKPIVNSNNQNQMLEVQALESQQLYVIKRTNNNQASLYNPEKQDEIIEDFEIKDKQGGVINNHLHFLEYINTKSMTIEIYDMNTQFLFGISKLDLKHLMAQGENFISKVIEVDVCDCNLGTIVGQLQIGIKIYGSYQFTDEQQMTQTSTSINKQNQLRSSQSKFTSYSPNRSQHQDHTFNQKTSKYKKKVFSKPVESVEGLIEKTMMSKSIQEKEEIRKMARVERLKMTMKEDLAKRKKDPLWRRDNAKLYYSKENTQRIQQTNLNMIEIMREMNKDSEKLLDKAIYHGVDFSFSIDAMPGKSYYFNLVIVNDKPTKQVYTIDVQDPDFDLYDDSEVSLVTSTQGEWDQLVKEEKSLKPQDYKVVSDQRDIILEAGQQTPLVFKYLTFRPVSRFQNKREVDDSSNHLRKYELHPRKISLRIISLENECFCHIHLMIAPRANHPDHFIKFYQPYQDAYQELQMQNFIPSSYDHSQIQLRTSTKKFKALFSQDKRSIKLLYKSAKAYGWHMGQQIFAYADRFFNKLVTCVEVDIFFLETYKLRQAIGLEQIFNIEYLCPRNAKLKIYSSNPAIASKAKTFSQQGFYRSDTVKQLFYDEEEDFIMGNRGQLATIHTSVKPLNTGLN